jgi:hypothetical protein
MKFKYKPGKEDYFDYLKKLIWAKKKKSSKKEKEEKVDYLSLDELNK